MSKEHDTFRVFARELRDLVWSIQEHRTGFENEQQISQLYLDLLDAIIDQAMQQQRAIRAMRGEKVEPMVHYAKAVITGTMGAG